MYSASTSVAPEGGSLVTVGGVRVQGPSSYVLIDLLVLSASDADCEATARELEDKAQYGESPPYVRLASAEDRPISMTNWRSSVLKRNPDAVLAVTSPAAIANPGDSMGAHRRSVTFWYEVADSTVWAHSAIASIDEKRMRHGLQAFPKDSFHPETVRIDSEPRSVPVVMIPETDK
jgi:hypothetical protein